MHGWGRVRRGSGAKLPHAAGRWTVPDVATTVFAFAIRWELGLAVVALKLWHQSSGYQGSMFAFAGEKWESLVGVTKSLLSGSSLPVSLHFGPRSSGNVAFDTWRQGELTRIESERERLRAAEREFAAYRDELLHVKDREDFNRFMQARDGHG